MSRPVALVLAAKSARTFAYGFLTILIPLHLAELGMSPLGLGAAITLTLLGSAALTWAIRGPAERLGPRPPLLALAGLSALAALILMSTTDRWLVVFAAMLGNIAVGTGETGPFLALEQVLVTREVAPGRRVMALSVYNLLGYAAGALGALAVGAGSAPLLFALFLGSAVVQLVLYASLAPTRGGVSGVSRPTRPSAPLIRRLAAFGALDSFAGGFVLQSLVAYFLHERFGLGLEALGRVFFASQLLTALSLLLAVRAARRFGLLNTMVWSHLVSNAFLIGIAFAPGAGVAIGLVLARQLLSQMDVPTRQAYVMALVEDREREAAASLTNLARTLAQAVSPALTGWVMTSLALSAPFVVGGVLKITYDLLMYLSFRNVPLRPED
jgi:MFS family permease